MVEEIVGMLTLDYDEYIQANAPYAKCSRCGWEIDKLDTYFVDNKPYCIECLEKALDSNFDIEEGLRYLAEEKDGGLWELMRERIELKIAPIKALKEIILMEPRRYYDWLNEEYYKEVIVNGKPVQNQSTNI